MRCPKAVARLPRRRCGRDQGASSRWERGPRLVAPEPPVPRMGQGRRRWGLGCGRRPTALPALTARATRPAAGNLGNPGSGLSITVPKRPSHPRTPVLGGSPKLWAPAAGGKPRAALGKPFETRGGAAGFAGLRRAEARGVHVSSSEAGGPQRAQSQAGADPRGPRGGQLVVPSAVCRPPVRPRSIRPGPGGVHLEPAGRPFDLVCRRG